MIKKRLCIFAHYDKDGLVDPYVHGYLESLMPFMQKIIFVSTSIKEGVQAQKLRESGIELIFRDNIGYDFLSWKLAVMSVSLGDYDEVFQVNDSCYAPLYRFDEIMKAMDGVECDFWGITKCRQVTTHMQSYFVCYRKKVLESDAFRNFWQEVGVLEHKSEIIRQYEIGLTRALLRGGFTMDSYFVPSVLTYVKNLPKSFLREIKKFRVRGARPSVRNMFFSNPSLCYYKEMLEERVPLVKVALVRDNPLGRPIVDLYGLESVDKHAVELMERHSLRVNGKGNTIASAFFRNGRR